ncbi:MAG: hypothetical protein JMDDDDMK_03848 [Acidobacteria bacterium]|nr:hypothetical protein [Acidobacteriota bacterium]
MRSLDIDPDCVGHFGVNRQRDINLATPGQAARQTDIDLIESSEVILSACE